jgi:predicted Zn-ribbon and HTH transcriptional regulator
VLIMAIKDEPIHCEKCGYNLRSADIGLLHPDFTGNEIMHHCRCYRCGYEWVEWFVLDKQPYVYIALRCIHGEY